MSWESFELRTRQDERGWTAWVHSELFDFENISTAGYGDTEQEAKDHCLRAAQEWCDDFREFMARQEKR